MFLHTRDFSVLNPTNQRKMWQLRASETLMKTLLTFVITFAICWAPNQFFYNFGIYVDFASPIYHITVILAVCNSCVNPIIYTVTNQPFRRGVREAFRKGRHSAQMGDMPTGTVSLAVSKKWCTSECRPEHLNLVTPLLRYKCYHAG